MTRRGTKAIRALSRIMVATATFIMGSSLPGALPPSLSFQPPQTAAAPGNSSGSSLLNEATALTPLGGGGHRSEGNFGSYVNRDYGFRVSLPNGLYGLSERLAPAPRHGIYIPLSAESSARLYAFAQDTGLSWCSIENVRTDFENDLRSFGRDATFFSISTRLGQFPAAHLMAHYTDLNTGLPMIEERIVAFREDSSGLSIVYEVGLKTETLRYEADQLLLMSLLSSWQFISLER